MFEHDNNFQMGNPRSKGGGCERVFPVETYVCALRQSCTTVVDLQSFSSVFFIGRTFSESKLRYYIILIHNKFVLGFSSQTQLTIHTMKLYEMSPSYNPSPEDVKDNGLTVSNGK